MKIIWRNEQIALVETAPDRRVIVPAGLEDDPEAQASGIPYGVDFSAWKMPPITGAKIAAELHRRGLWTAADIHAQPRMARAALDAAASDIVKEFFAQLEEVTK